VLAIMLQSAVEDCNQHEIWLHAGLHEPWRYTHET